MPRAKWGKYGRLTRRTSTSRTKLTRERELTSHTALSVIFTATSRPHFRPSICAGPSSFGDKIAIASLAERSCCFRRRGRVPSIVRERRPRRLLLRAREDFRTSSSALSWPCASRASQTLLKLPAPRGLTSSSVSEELERVVPGSSAVGGSGGGGSGSGSDGGGVGGRCGGAGDGSAEAAWTRGASWSPSRGAVGVGVTWLDTGGRGGWTTG